MELSLFHCILLLSFSVPLVKCQCTSCDDGIEFRDADPLGDGFYRCNNVDNFYLFAFAENSAECKQAQLEVMNNCCPSQVKDIPKDNACGWCPNGVTNLGVAIQFFETDPITCEELMLLVATGTPETGICAIANSVSSICCPGDESSGSIGPFSCKFCGSTGVEFPAKILPEAENLTCSKIGAAALLANETVCNSLVKPLEDSCCPNYEGPSGCEFCVSGLDDPSLELPLISITCEQLKASALSAAEGTQCDATFKPAESLCCPSTIETISCDFCSSGLVNPTAAVPSFEGWTCQDFQDSSSTVSTKTDCSFIKSAEISCCPNNADLAVCEFCPGGLESPNETVPLLGGVTCSDFRDAAESIIDSAECETSIKPLEGLCCPSTTESFQCDWCSEVGVEFPEREFTGLGLRCGTISALVPAVTYEELCDQYKASERLCCPSSLDIDPNSVTDDEDYCHICGSADVEMKRPHYQPFTFGSSDDSGDQRTCAELEVSFNTARSAGDSCIDALSLFNLRFSPSICGCEGMEPSNPCEVCSGKDVNRDIQVPGENFTCGEGFDFLQHVSPVFCSNPEIDLVAIEGVCCTDIFEDGGAGDTTASIASAVGTGLFVAFALHMMRIVLM